MGVGLNLPNLASLPGPSRPGGGVGPEPEPGLSSFNSTTSPVSSVEEACESSEIGEMYKANTGAVEKGDDIYSDVEGESPAANGYYKQATPAEVYVIDDSVSGKPGVITEVIPCE